MSDLTSEETYELRHRRMKAAEMALETATFERIQDLADELVIACGDLRWGDGTAQSMALEQVVRAVDRTRVDADHRDLNPTRKTNSKRRWITQGLRRSVWDRDGWTCVACGTHKDLTVDHIHPVALGGGNEFENLQTMCGSCNSRKGARI